MAIEIVKCAVCHRNVIKKSKNQKFCSIQCCNEKHKPKRPRAKKECPECLTVFNGTKKDKYCSIDCVLKVKSRKNKIYRTKEGIRMKCKVCGRMFVGKFMSPICSLHCKSLYNKGEEYD